MKTTFLLSRFLRRLTFALLALSLACAFDSAARAQTTWEWRTPTPTGNRVASFAASSSLTVGVGEFGTILTTSDGVNWTLRASGTTGYLQRVVYGAGKFVAFGPSDTLVSTDGLTWTPSSDRFLDLEFGHGLFVALVAPTPGESPFEIRTSPDLATWTTRRSLSYIPSRLRSTNDIFVAPNTGGGVITSADGLTWTDVQVVTLAAATTPYFAAGNNRFLLSYGTQTYLSTDGLSWTEVTQTLTSDSNPGAILKVPNLGSRSTLGFALGYFYLQQSQYSGDPYVQYRSADGRNWTRLPSNLANFDFSTLASGPDFAVATEVNQLRSTFNAQRFYLHSSTDGLAWTTASASLLPARTQGWPVYGLGRYFVAGYSSPDGRSWVATPFEPTHAAGDRLFRFVSDNGYGYILPEIYGNFTTTASVSADGLTSTTIDPKMPTPRSVAFGGGRYVIVGDSGQISTSTDALAWSLTPSPTTAQLNAVTYAFGRFIAVGANGTLLTSPDGLAWTDESTAALAGLNFAHLAAGSDRLVVATSASSSSTPAALTLAGGTPVYFATTHRYSSLIFFNGAWIANGYVDDSSYSSQTCWTSTDGLTWTNLFLGAGGGVYGSTRRLATGNGTALLFAPADNSSSITLSPYTAILQTPDPTPAVAPTIVNEPVSRSVARGETATFAVGVTGTGPFTYQWYRGGVAIDGATASLLTLNLADTTDAAAYSVKVTNSAGATTSAAATLTVTPAVPLAITQQPVGGPLYDNTSVTLSVAVTGSGPLTYQWRKDGQSITGATSASYAIYGNPYSTTAYTGSYDCVVTAPYSTVTSQAAVVTWGGPTVTVSPSGIVSRVTGESITFTATATGTAPLTYRWTRTIGGLDVSGPTLTLTNLTDADSSPYKVTVTDAGGHSVQGNFILSVAAAAPAPVITAAPVSQTVREDGSVTLSVAVNSPELYTYQWRKNGVAIDGATSATLTLDHFAAADAADYDVVISAPGIASVTTAPATLTFGYAHLANLSVRAYAGTGEATLIQGFVLAGAPASDLLVRSVGPSLLRFGLTGTVADPAVKIITGSGDYVGGNDDWPVALPSSATTDVGALATTDTMNRLGAFPLNAASHDAAVVLRALPSGLYMAQASGASGTTGLVLNEIYAEPTATQRLVNLSARARVGTGDDLLIGGFVISGNQPLRVLIRGVGPGLANQGVSAPLTNPKLTLYNAAGDPIHNNDNWGDAANLADLRTAATAVGAFTLTEGSNDAATLETLEPGVYSVHVTSADGTPGIALVEIYAVP